MNHDTRMNESWHTYEWVMAHIWMSHVTHMKESCRTCEWVVAHVRMSHGTHTKESCHTHGWVPSHMWIRHVSHMNVSCHTCEWVVSHIWMSHAAHEWVMAHIWMSHVTRMNESSHLKHIIWDECDFFSHSSQIICVLSWQRSVWHDSFISHTSKKSHSSQLKWHLTHIIWDECDFFFWIRADECENWAKVKKLLIRVDQTNARMRPIRKNFSCVYLYHKNDACVKFSHSCQ